MSDLALILFGDVQLKFQNEPITSARQTKPLALLAYLALSHGQFTPRTQLASLLWGDQSESAARNSLRQSLFIIRKWHPSVDHALEADETSVRLAANALWLDVQAFENGSSDPRNIAALEQAIALYKAPFLFNLVSTDSAQFEEWMMQQRERLEQRAISTLDTLAQHDLAASQFDKAEQWARRMIEIDTLNESAHRHLMAALAQRGNKASALQEYERLSALLRHELGVEPAPETLRLVEQVRSDVTLSNAKPVTAAVQIHLAKCNLPQINTPLVGRDDELGDLLDMLSVPDHRLVTLLGMGGIGKTRLALAAAHESRAYFAERVWWVDLSAITSPRLIEQSIANALGVREGGRDNLAETIGALLQSQRALIVLDNCEHIIAESAQVAESLLRHCSVLRLIATSREPLGLIEEQALSLNTLPLEIATEFFATYAQRARRDFSLVGQIESVRELCRQLDCWPLAIELAASHMRTFTPAQLISQFSSATSMARSLGGVARTRPQRHQTLFQTIQWSYDLLTRDEQAVFCCMGVFVGGASLSELCSVTQRELSHVLPIVESLADKSLIFPLDRVSEPRFGVLDSIREFARAQLTAQNQIAPKQETHAQYFLRLVEESARHIRKDNAQAAATWLGAIERTYSNIRAAQDFCLTQNKLQECYRFAIALETFWGMRSHVREGFGWMRSILDLPMPEPADDDLVESRCRTLLSGGEMARFASDMQTAQKWHTQAVTLARRLTNPDMLIMALEYQASTLRLIGLPHEALAAYQEGLAIHQAQRGAQSNAANYPGWITFDEVDAHQARIIAENRVALCRQQNDVYALSIGLIALGDVLRWQRDDANARACYNEALSLCRAAGDRNHEAWALHNLAYLALHVDDKLTAHQQFESAYKIFRALDREFGMCACVIGLAILLDDSYEQARWFGACAANLKKIQRTMDPVDQREYGYYFERAKSKADEAQFLREYERGQTLQLVDLIK